MYGWKALLRHQISLGRSLRYLSDDKASRLVGIDRSKLHIPHVEKTKTGAAESMVAHLTQRIHYRNALTVADYMRECLTNPHHGYYIKNEVFGRTGDFTTAPEISQVFGECLGIWILKTFAAITSVQKPKGFKIVELGPGRGTLMRDISRIIKSATPTVFRNLEIQFMEVSPKLREVQRATMGAYAHELLGLHWFENLSQIPEPDGMATIYIAQEFFDALAVHQFLKTDKGWCERMIDVEVDPNAEFPFRYVLSRGATAASTVYKPLLPAGVEQVEISPDAYGIAETLGSFIGASDGLGACLVVDYGKVGPIESSLRAIRNHKIEPALLSPGEADLSVDVDFGLLSRGFRAGGDKHVDVYGPISQRQLLHSLGGVEKAYMLADSAEAESQKTAVLKSYERLSSPDQMGDIYKAMAVTHSDVPTPVAF
mmetsp:Transcript_10751/g.44817  ORF Transcript_10751/g.44817 Transcript_10751/m.44817 type:complete len:427 (-) Transcript_10751:839-2119(-)